MFFIPITPLVVLYLAFGLGFAWGFCPTRQVMGNRVFQIILFLAAIVAWPMGCGLFVGGWLAKYWPDHPEPTTKPISYAYSNPSTHWWKSMATKGETRD